MMNPEVVKDLFREVQAAFPQIVGVPNDDDVKRLTEAFVNALQSIDVPGGAIDLSNLLLSDAEHESKHGDGKTFKRMAVPLPAYDDSIASDATNAVRAKAERLWTAKIGLQTLIKTVERAERAFLIAVVVRGANDLWEGSLHLPEEVLRDFRGRHRRGGVVPAAGAAGAAGGSAVESARTM